MKKVIFLFWILSFPLLARSQNLVPNPSFETNTSCPSAASQISKAEPWYAAGGSPDYFNTCASVTDVKVPLNHAGDEMAADGEGYVGLYIFQSGSSFREYLGVRLSSPLKAGSSYEIRFQYSLADRFNYATDRMGLYFSSSPVTGSALSNATPQLTMPFILDEKDGWEEVSLCYMAKGGETYLTIGNFVNIGSTLTVSVGTSGINGCFVYLDDFSITSNDSRFSLGNDTTLCQGETFALTMALPDASFVWQDSSTAPVQIVTHEGIYWATAELDGCKKTDSIHISFDKPPSADLGDDLTICMGDTLNFDLTAPSTTYLWQDGDTEARKGVYSAGLYWVQASSTHCTSYDTLRVWQRECHIVLEIPNAITPNGDGLNDLLVPIASDGIVSMHTQVFNRWGIKVFETDNVWIEWDAGGMSSGTYFWKADYTDLNDEQHALKGHVLVMK